MLTSTVSTNLGANTNIIKGITYSDKISNSFFIIVNISLTNLSQTLIHKNRIILGKDSIGSRDINSDEFIGYRKEIINLLG